jgi:hypothetical protein
VRPRAACAGTNSSADSTSSTKAFVVALKYMASDLSQQHDTVIEKAMLRLLLKWYLHATCEASASWTLIRPSSEQHHWRGLSKINGEIPCIGIRDVKVAEFFALWLARIVGSRGAPTAVGFVNSSVKPSEMPLFRQSIRPSGLF